MEEIEKLEEFISIYDDELEVDFVMDRVEFNILKKLIQGYKKLKIENEKLQKKHKIVCKLNVGVLENMHDYIPKQTIRELIEKHNKIVGYTYYDVYKEFKKILGED